MAIRTSTDNEQEFIGIPLPRPSLSRQAIIRDTLLIHDCQQIPVISEPQATVKQLPEGLLIRHLYDAHSVQLLWINPTTYRQTPGAREIPQIPLAAVPRRPVTLYSADGVMVTHHQYKFRSDRISTAAPGRTTLSGQSGMGFGTAHRPAAMG